jgi:hypothetical protein
MNSGQGDLHLGSSMRVKLDNRNNSCLMKGS